MTATGAARLGDVERYLRAAARRLERLPNARSPSHRDRMNAVHELERLYRERLTTAARPDLLRDVPWMLEEAAPSATSRRRSGYVAAPSSKRIRRVLDEAVKNI